MLEVLALIISALAIATYVRLAWTGDARAFNWVNALGWPILVVSVQHHAWPAATLNLFFTLVGTLGVITAWRKKRAEREYADVLVELGKLEDVGDYSEKSANTVLRQHGLDLRGLPATVVGSVNQKGGVTANTINLRERQIPGGDRHFA